MLFGVYAGSAAGDDRGGMATGPDDDPTAILAALRAVQGGAGRPFLVRSRRLGPVRSSGHGGVGESGLPRASCATSSTVAASGSSPTSTTSGSTSSPDGFSPIDPGRLADAVRWLLAHQRHDVLAPAGCASVPLHITEHGWPTAPGRDPDRQAEVIDTVVRTAHAADLAIDAYVHFSLRDADSGADGLFHHFGLLDDRYAPKPSFATMCALVAELSGDAP